MCNCKKSSSARASVLTQPAPVVSGNSSRKQQSVARKPRSLETSSVRATAPVVIDGETLADKCRTLGYMLGLEHPVTESVLTAAVENPGYARDLLGAVNNPDRLSDLLNNAPQQQSMSTTAYTTAKLLSKASSALLKWTLSGFPTVSKETLQKREEACLSCPNLTAPTHRLQQATASATVYTQVGRRTGNKTCSACGCVIVNKIRLATESCPVEAQNQPGMNRWGEPILHK